MVSRVVAEGEGKVVEEAVALAKEISGKGAIAVQACKEMVNVAHEVSLAEGLRFERRLFHGLFATNDQKEGEYHSIPAFAASAEYLSSRYGRVCREAPGKLHSFIDKTSKHITISVTVCPPKRLLFRSIVVEAHY